MGQNNEYSSINQKVIYVKALFYGLRGERRRKGRRRGENTPMEWKVKISTSVQLKHSAASLCSFINIPLCNLACVAFPWPKIIQSIGSNASQKTKINVICITCLHN